MHFHNVDLTSFVDTLYLSGDDNNSTIYIIELYQQSQYDACGTTNAWFAGKLQILVFLDSGCIFSTLTKHFMIQTEILHKCLNIPTDNITIHTRNGDKMVFLLDCFSIPYITDYYSDAIALYVVCKLK